MKAVARLIWLHCTALPIQRWLGAIVLATLPLAASPWLRTRGFVVFPVVAMACYSVATTFASAHLLRVLSASSAHRFLPRFRGRSLGAFCGVLVVVSVPWLVLYALTAAQRTHASLLLVPFFLLTVIVAISFFPRGGAAVLLACGTTIWLIDHLTDWRPGGFAALGLWVGLWIAFSIWYVRVRRIPPPSLRWFGEGGHPSRAEWLAPLDADMAAAKTLSGGYLPRARHTLGWLLPVTLVAFLAVMVTRGAHALHAYAYFFYPPLAVSAALLAAVVNRRARRTKLLWLKQGLSRRELFAATERWIWRFAVPRAVVANVAIAGAIALAYDLQVRSVARALACGLASAVLGVYAGLADVRGSRAFAVAQLLLFLCLSTSIWIALVDPERDAVLAAVILGQLAAALALRALAIRSWRQIDWLVFRPQRVPYQGLRTGF